MTFRESRPSNQDVKDFRSKSVSYADKTQSQSYGPQLTRTQSEPRADHGAKHEIDTKGTNGAVDRKKSIDTIGLHYYPEGGWGYVVCIGAFVIQFAVYGFVGSCGCFYVFVIHHFGSQYYIQTGKSNSFI